MKQWKAFAMGMATVAGLTPSLWAQPALPGAAGAAATPAGATAAAGTAGGAADSGFGFIQKCQDTKEKCKNKLCKTPLGKMLNSMTRLPSLMSGGIIPMCCPEEPNKFGLQEAKEKGGAEGAAAAIKKEEAEAKARREAVRYLGTVDCHYYPEASKALINSLRADRNECVRWEAAMALGNGCCCNKNTIEAMLITVTCSDKDGNPVETSPRVRHAALMSLQHCLSCYCESTPADKKETPLEKKAAEKSAMSTLDGGNVQLTAYYVQHLPAKPMTQTVEEAKKVVAEMKSMPHTSNSLPSGSQGLFNIVASAVTTPEGSVTQTSSGPLFSVDSKTQHLEPAQPKPGSLKELLTRRRESQRVNSTTEVVVVPTETPVATPARKFEPVAAPTVRKNSTTTVTTPVLNPVPSPTSRVTPKPATTIESKPTASVLSTPKPTSVSQSTAKTVQPVALTTVTTTPKSAAATSIATTPKSVASTPVQVASALPRQNVVTRPTESVPTPTYSAEAIPMLLSLLRNSVNPFQREWAVESLGSTDWRSNAEVVPALVKSAKEDASATVRTSCVRRLTAMNVQTPQVVSTFQALKSDPDPRVQHAAEQGLKKFNTVSSTRRDSAPASGSFRGN